MTTFKELQLELRNKERSVNDLIRFIKTRADQNPNYSLFLGAGCSITSGINSATELIRKWKKDIYINENDIEEEDYDEKNVDDFFEQKMWYDSRNPYSALFERKYDLPRQRRMFVEQEVRDKLPSIGYSYLIKLVENNFFKTLFTTNFDDLLNESFYQYSTRRPILCAHDSAISSITITSKRPKIIKLHGDYLFDDIKSTLRETESLEENIKNKFIEFAKDYGLVIIGYGGNDRSIVDILTYLLKNEDYFKNGIYWCLREDTEINEDLRKLLWKDRVYYVKITGFDELMAEMNNKLNNKILPIDSSYLNEKKDKIIEQLITNPFLKNTNCKYIIDDFEKLNKTKEKDVISNFFKYVNTKDDTNDNNNDGFIVKNTNNVEISNKEQEFLTEIQQELFTGNYQLAYSLINKKIDLVNTNSQYYINLVEIYAKCLRKLKKNEEAIEQYKILISKQKDRLNLYIILSNLVVGQKEKIEWIDKALLIDPYYYSLYNEKASLLFNDYDNSINKENFDLKKILEITDKSIQVNPSISNSGWMLRLDVLKKTTTDNNKFKEIFKEIIESLEVQDKYHPNIVKKKIELFSLSNEKYETINDFIIESINNSNSVNYKKYNELELLKFYSEENKTTDLKNRIKQIEDNYIIDDDFLLLKSRFQLEKFNNLNDAIKTLQSIKTASYKSNLQLFSYLLYDEKFEEAENLLINNLDNNKELYEDLYSAKKQYDKALEIIQELLTKTPNDYQLCVSESYLLLKNDEFKKAYYLLGKYLKPSNFTDIHLLVNYFIATKKYKKSIKEEKVKDKLLNAAKDDNLIAAAAYAILDDKKNAYIKLSTLIKNDYSRKYSIRDWIVFEDLFKIDKFKELLK